MKPLYELCRPEALTEIILDEELSTNLTKLTDSFESMPHMIFYGPPGTGKTTTSRAIARKILKKLTDFNYLELNASVDRGVDVVRSAILKFASTPSFFKLETPEAPYKIIFLDEADSITTDAQNALRNMMETYISSCRFILSCNNLSKIIPPLLSRCLALNFKPLTTENMLKRLNHVNLQFNLNLKKEAIERSVEESKGDFRKAFNMLSSSNWTDLDSQVESIVKFLSNDSYPLAKVAEVIKLKRSTIELYHKLIFQNIVETLVANQDFQSLDRLAKAESCILNGGSVITQLLGYIGFKKK